MPARVSRRHKSRKGSPGAIVGLALGLMVAGAAFLGYTANRAEQAEQDPGPARQVEPPPIARNPFEFADAMSAPGAGAPVETELKSLVALEVMRGHSRLASWALAVDSAAKAYPLMVTYRERRAADVNNERWDWQEPGRAALELFAKADEYGGRVEQRMRDEREIGPHFESIREARSEWLRYRRELERAVGTLDSPRTPSAGSDG